MHTARPVLTDPLGAFCRDTEAYLPGASSGPLLGLTFAAKDIFDVAGYVTGGGNPDWKATHAPAAQTAWAVQTLVDAGATMVGKTLTDEITRGIFGENAHDGTPVNPRAPGRLPGGSSSGSAAAVAGGLVDCALGSDTGGSVRVPASFCGLYGMRPTHGRIPLSGLLMQAPSYDTIGWFAREADLLARVGAVLLRSTIPAAGLRRLVIAEDAFALADAAVAAALQPYVARVAALCGQTTRLCLAPDGLAAWSEQQQILQGREAWETAQDWIDQVNPRFSFEVAERYVAARAITAAEIAQARQRREAIRQRLDTLLDVDAVLCLPTTPVPAPLRGERLSARRDVRARLSMLTCIAGTTGRPQINLPVATVDGLPVGLSLLGAPGMDERLLACACDLAVALSR
ncbi:MAG: amidase [Candidatus Tectimicrobiota bacterium]